MRLFGGHGSSSQHDAQIYGLNGLCWVLTNWYTYDDNNFSFIMQPYSTRFHPFGNIPPPPIFQLQTFYPLCDFLFQIFLHHAIFLSTWKILSNGWKFVKMLHDGWEFVDWRWKDVIHPLCATFEIFIMQCSHLPLGKRMRSWIAICH
jgi:hypothetical protein